jgi:hypothetical protein
VRAKMRGMDSDSTRVQTPPPQRERQSARRKGGAK